MAVVRGLPATWLPASHPTGDAKKGADAVSGRWLVSSKARLVMEAMIEAGDRATINAAYQRAPRFPRASARAAPLRAGALPWSGIRSP